MLDRDHLDHVLDEPVVNDIWEAVQSNSTDALILRGIKFRRLADTVEYLLDGCKELSP